MQKKQDKSVKIEASYEIDAIKISNGMVYLKISQNNGTYKWIKYCTATESSKELENVK